VTDLMGIPATGKPIRVDAVSVFRVENGKIAQHICLWDTLTMLQQIGAVPEPAVA
jgi:predicted ester cyclase